MGDGVANDRAAIQAALAATLTAGTKTVLFPAGIYWLGTVGVPTTLLDLGALGDNLSLETEGVVQLTTQTLANGIQPAFIGVLNNNYLRIGPMRFTDFGYNEFVAARGAIGVHILGWPTINYGSIRLDSLHGYRIAAVVRIEGQTPPNNFQRMRGLSIGQLFAFDCYYGFNARNDGDAVTIEQLEAWQTYHAYYVHGVTGHTVDRLFNSNPRLTTGSVIIARSNGGLDTRGIAIKYTARDTMPASMRHVTLQHDNLLGGEISGINIEVDIDDTSGATYYPVRIVNLTGSPAIESTLPSNNIVRDIRLSGSVNPQALAVEVVGSYATKGHMTFITGNHFFPNQSILDKFQMNRSVRNTPGLTWQGATTNPSLGNGSLLYDLDVANSGFLQLTIRLFIGSTTTFGSGVWSFSGFGGWVPTVGTVGTCLAIGPQYFVGAAFDVGPGGIACYGNGAATGFGATVPFAWASGHLLVITVLMPLTGP